MESNIRIQKYAQVIIYAHFPGGDGYREPSAGVISVFDVNGNEVTDLGAAGITA